MNCREAPSVVTCSASNRACTPNALPVRRWQARQWQIETRTGSPSTVSRSCSQLHAACRVITSGIVFDVFPDDSGRDAHLSGRVAEALMAQADELLARSPDIQKVDVIASKMPAQRNAPRLTHGFATARSRAARAEPTRKRSRGGSSSSTSAARPLNSIALLLRRYGRSSSGRFGSEGRCNLQNGTRTTLPDCGSRIQNRPPHMA
jgi:hypothetical protein